MRISAIGPSAARSGGRGPERECRPVPVSIVGHFGQIRARRGFEAHTSPMSRACRAWSDSSLSARRYAAPALIASVVLLASGCGGGSGGGGGGGSSASATPAPSTTVAPAAHIASHGFAIYRVAPSSDVGVCETRCASPEGTPLFLARSIVGVHGAIGRTGTWTVLLSLHKADAKRFSEATAELGDSSKVLFTANGRPILVLAWTIGRQPTPYIQINDLTQARATRIENDLQPLKS
jgi:hypothetical protein